MFKKYAILILIAFVGFSCEEDEMNVELTKLEKQKLIWQLNRPADYSYRIFKTCLCPAYERGPFKVTVRNYNIADIQYLGARPLEIQSSMLSNANLQLDSLFGTMQQHFLQNPDKVLIDYDPEYGYPAEVSIDFIRTTTDDEVGIFISNFELLPKP